MPSNELRSMQTPELQSKLDDTREELFKLRFQYKTGQLTDYSRLRATRREIARLLTLLRERELAEAIAAKGEEA